MAKKKLPDLKELKKSNQYVRPITALLKTNEEVSGWLEQIFDLKDKGEIDISFRGIAEELSLFLEREIPGRVVNSAYQEWQRKNKQN